MELYAHTYRCPDVVSQEDALIIRETLQNAPGIEEVEVDHADHSVYVRTANQEGLQEIVAMLTTAGYPPEL